MGCHTVITARPGRRRKLLEEKTEAVRRGNGQSEQTNRCPHVILVLQTIA